MKRSVKFVALLCIFMLAFACVALTGCNNTQASTDRLPNLKILWEEDSNMKNTYSILCVNPNAPFTDANGEAKAPGSVQINTAAAETFLNWMTSASASALIEQYGETTKNPDADEQYATDNGTVRISTTTSVNDSGLMEYLRPTFEKETGYKWEIASAGTGAAINAAKYGNADVILVHSKKSEEEFVEAGFSYVVEGYTSERVSFMHNFFVLVGPKTDPAGVLTVKATDGKTVKDAFAAIASTQSTFISRGDKSGTHNKEWTLWPESVGIVDNNVDNIPAAIASWYISAGSGMGACLLMANELNAYVLTDKATFLSYKNNSDSGYGEKLFTLDTGYKVAA